MKISVKNLEASLWNDFVAYFEFKGKCSGCWCMNHRLPIGLDFEGEAAKLAMEQMVKSARVHGVLAYVEGDSVPIGWCSVDRRRTLPGHDCIAEDIDCDKNIWSIHCITVRDDFKSEDVQRTLIIGAEKLIKSLDGKEIEVYPEPSSEFSKPFSTWNTFNAHQKTFEELSFKRIEKDFAEQEEFFYPMRKKLI